MDFTCRNTEVWTIDWKINFVFRSLLLTFWLSYPKHWSCILWTPIQLLTERRRTMPTAIALVVLLRTWLIMRVSACRTFHQTEFWHESSGLSYCLMIFTSTYIGGCRWGCPLTDLCPCPVTITQYSWVNGIDNMNYCPLNTDHHFGTHQVSHWISTEINTSLGCGVDKRTQSSCVPTGGGKTSIHIWLSVRYEEKVSVAYVLSQVECFG